MKNNIVYDTQLVLFNEHELSVNPDLRKQYEQTGRTSIDDFEILDNRNLLD